ncbi:MAG: SDR family NAD(P)-dependent oxidoreductase [Acidobacteria bacterium]|nr:SDR family NAD(P)-dependent oxidoreductase [Acidobacteriota bacterium]
MTNLVTEPPVEPSTVVELLTRRATEFADKRVYLYLADGEVEAAQLTFTEVDRRARAIAATLQQKQAAGESALLLYPASLDFATAFFGCLYGGVIGVPAYPPHPQRVNRTLPRLQAIAADAKAKFVMTTRQVYSMAEMLFDQAPDLARMEWIVTDEIPDAAAETWQPPDITPDSLAFLQYTSGSTSIPKGVMVTHRNMLCNAAYYRDGWEHTPDTVTVTWMPNFHDLGLMDGIIQPIYTGYQSVLMSPVAFLQRPLRWLQAISKYRASYSAGPNFAFDLCVRKISPEQRAALDLSCWKAALNAAEPVRRETMERFTKAFEGCGFRWKTFSPGFGLAEATLKVSATRREDEPVFCTVDAQALEQHKVIEVPPSRQDNVRVLAGCGRPTVEPSGVRVVIVNPDSLTACATDEVGEIWVSGPGVAVGYWRREEETEHTFGAYLADTGEGPFLRTGDLGFMRDGVLFIAGRLKDMIIIDGRNLYPHDIELTVEQSHPAIRPGCTAAFSVDSADGEHLVVVAEIERRERARGGERKPSAELKDPSAADVRTIQAAIRQAVAEFHDVHVYTIDLIKPGTILKTSSGKIQRQACRQAFQNRMLEFLPTETPSLGLNEDSSSPVLTPLKKTPNAEEIQVWLIDQLARYARIPATRINVHDEFSRFGLASRDVVSLTGDFEQWLGRKLSPTLFYTYPSIYALSRHLAGGQDSIELISHFFAGQNKAEEPIAIIGIGCRFPGANSPEAFWQLLCDGVDMIREVPAERRGKSGFYPTDPSKTYWGSFLDDIDLFDYGFFGISRREAEHMDPQQRLLLEVTWEALDDAGLAPQRLSGSKVGVFVGLGVGDYGRIQVSSPHCRTPYTAVGSSLSIVSNRISYVFNFLGPSISIDTACSSSLVAIHQACQSLRQGESVLALAGGVNLLLSHEVTENLIASSFLSPDGHCWTFDARANGYVRGEGAGLVVLKPLSKALTDNDSIYAVIRGSAVNQDGRSNGLTAPSQHAQEAVLQEAYARAMISPSQVQYIEAHGTGTSLGDPIEVKALGKVLSQDRGPGSKCAIGSVKTNIGHLEPAAGIAGLIKVALALKNRTIPPSLHFDNPNPYIPFSRLPLYVQTQLSPWPRTDGPMLAGVNSFGFGGTNAHAVLEGIPPISNFQNQAESRPQTAYLLPISARTPEALTLLAERFQAHLVAQPNLNLYDFCRTASFRRDHYEYRLAVVGSSRDQLIEKLGVFLAGETTYGLAVGRKIPGQTPKVAFVFSGQGNQWAGMGVDLIDASTPFRKVLKQCDEYLQGYGGWSVFEELQAHAAHSRLSRTDIAQPTIFSLQVALAAFWKQVGIVPDAVVGHSMGEVAAAHVAGVLTLQDALHVIFHRGRIMEKAAGKGKTAAAAISETEFQELLKLFPTLSVAAENSPTSLTVSGDPKSVEALVEHLQSRGIFARVITQNYAFHSPQLDFLQHELAGTLYGLTPHNAAIPIFSTVTGKPPTFGDFSPAYWGRNLREPVCFTQAIETMAPEKYEVFLELGPHAVLSPAIRECFQSQKLDTVILSSLRRGENGFLSLCSSLATLYAKGCNVNWSGLYGTSGHRIKLPSYPWQRERCWIDVQWNQELNSKPLIPSIKETPSDSLDGWLHQLIWKQIEVSSTTAESTGNWLIFSDLSGIGDSLAQSLTASGATCFVVHPGSDFEISDSNQVRLNPASRDQFRQLFDWLHQTGAIPSRVLYLWPLNAPTIEQFADSTFETTVDVTCTGILFTLQEVFAQQFITPPLFWIGTQGVQNVSNDPTLDGLLQSPVWGFGRTLSREMPQYWGGMFDLDTHFTTEESVHSTRTAILNLMGEDQLAFRKDGIYGLRLVKVTQNLTLHPSLVWRTNASYLITGGLGGLGLIVAQWMAQQGARRLILTSRTPLPARNEWKAYPEDSLQKQQIAAIRDLEALGVNVQTIALDVSSAEQLGQFLQTYADEGWPPIRGVIHAAGVLEDQSLYNLNREALLSVTRVKILGTWHLANAFSPEELDFFVNFSSLASVLGSPGQANYAAGNTFQDAIVHWLRQNGYKASTINWGPWAEVGMAARNTAAGKNPASGINLLSPATGLQILHYNLDSQVPTLIGARFDWGQLKQLFPSLMTSPLLNYITEPTNQPAPPPSQTTVRLGLKRETYFTMPLDDRRQLLEEYLQTAVAQTLGIKPSRVEQFTSLMSLGFDSLMAVTLRSQIESDLGAVLPVASFLQEASLNTLTTTLHQSLSATPAPATVKITAISLEPPVSPPVPLNHSQSPRGTTDDLLDKVDQLSDEQVKALLQQMLTSGGSSHGQ